MSSIFIRNTSIYKTKVPVISCPVWNLVLCDVNIGSRRWLIRHYDHNELTSPGVTRVGFCLKFLSRQGFRHFWRHTKNRTLCTWKRYDGPSITKDSWLSQFKYTAGYIIRELLVFDSNKSNKLLIKNLIFMTRPVYFYKWLLVILI